MNTRRRARAALRPLLVPDWTPAPHHRAPIGADALNAALTAHMGDEHDGQPGRGCRTCQRYITARAAARAAEQQPRPPPRGTMHTCRGRTAAAAPPATDANTAPNAPATSPHSNAPDQAAAPNASASNAPA